MRFQEIPQLMNGGNYHVDVCWTYLESWLNKYSEDGGSGFDLNPDFQRAHVWDDEKRASYVQFILRGGESSYDVHWNSPGGVSSAEILTIVDGKQRIEAVRKFMRNELFIFGGDLYKDYTDKLSFSVRFRMHVNNLNTRAEVIEWYLQLNEGGVAHTEDELSRVRKLLAVETNRTI